MDGERKREEGAHFLTFFMLHASRTMAVVEREREGEGRGGLLQGTAPPPDETSEAERRAGAGLPPQPLRALSGLERRG
jgi:hypothetical protein